MLIFAALLSVAFGVALYDWAALALKRDLYSHTLLIPVISGYLVWIKRHNLPAFAHGQVTIALLPAVLGVGILAAYFLVVRNNPRLPQADYLCLMMMAYLSFLAAGAIFFLGLPFLRSILFPVLFLLFMVPFPEFVENGIEQFFQRWSAEATALFYQITGTSFIRDGQTFRLPGITIVVAQECSGIRSSLVLFITSLLAGHLFLRSAWKKGFLTFFVIPLGIFRNGFRILTITLLCIHVDPNYINSPLHHSGGPVFFALSLVPFLLVLYLLRRADQKGEKGK